jgi:hypothetical protein
MRAAAKVLVIAAACFVAGCQTRPAPPASVELGKWEQATPTEREALCAAARERLDALRADARARASMNRRLVCTPQGGCSSRPGPVLQEPFGPEAERMNQLASFLEQHCQ